MKNAIADEPPMRLEIKESTLKQIKGWEVGKTYRIIVTAEMTGIDKGWDGKGPVRATFIVSKAESAGEAKGSKTESKTEPKMSARGNNIAGAAKRAIEEDDDYDD